MKYVLGLLAVLSVGLLGVLTGLAIKQNNEIEDLQTQIEAVEEQIEQQQDYIKELHKYINDYTYEDGRQVFVYIDEDGNHYD